VSSAAFNSPIDACVLKDINGDGNLDLAAMLLNNAGMNILVGTWEGIGDGGFQHLTTVPIIRPGKVKLADLTGDGLIDLFTPNVVTGTANVYPGTGSTDFSAAIPVVLDAGSYPFDSVSADFDVDGIVDLAVANLGEHTLSVVRGLGGGAFAPELIFTVSSNANTVAAADLNGDGLPDLVVATQAPGSVEVLLNTSR
jgi:hypothetical protein